MNCGSTLTISPTRNERPQEQRVYWRTESLDRDLHRNKDRIGYQGR